MNRDAPTSTIPLDLSVRRLSTELFQRERFNSFSSSYSDEHARVNIELMMEGKENLSIDSNSVTPEQIVCAPSLPGSPPLTPSPKRNSQSPRGILAASPNLIMSSGSASTGSLHHQQQSAMLRSLLPNDLADRLAPFQSNPLISESTCQIGSSPMIYHRKNVELALRLSTAASNNVTIDNSSQSQSQQQQQQQMKSNQIHGLNKKTNLSTTSSGSAAAATHNSHGQPQIFVKQGVSKCKECNIVFCKYENYLAHKKHYCSARNLDDKDGAPKVSPPPSSSPIIGTNSTNSGSGSSTIVQAPPTPHAYQQLICAACGIKFTSLDNLSAHQMYYCPKRIDIPIQVIQIANFLDEFFHIFLYFFFQKDSKG